MPRPKDRTAVLDPSPDSSKETSRAPEAADRVWRIAVYMRLSKDDGADESASIVNQRKILYDYLYDNFSADECSAVEEYLDDGISGVTQESRQEFQRLVRDCEAGKVNCIVVKSINRMFRNHSDQGHFLEEFIVRHNIRLIALVSPFIDTYTAPDSAENLEVPIMGIMNDRYCKITSEAIRRTFHTKRQNGEFIGAFPPYGYSKHPQNKNKLVIDEEAAQVVRDVYHWFVMDGMSKTSIAKKLSAMGVPTPSNYKTLKGQKFSNPKAAKSDGSWAPTTVRDILKNRMYAGDMVQGKQRTVSYKVKETVATSPDEWYVVPNVHEAIVSRELYEQAQALNRRDTRVAPDRQTVYLFSGFIRCNGCKKAMGRAAHTQRNTVYYRCKTHATKGTCSGHRIREDCVYNAVLDAINAQIGMIGDPTGLLDEIDLHRARETQSNRQKDLLRCHERKLDQLANALSGLYLDWKSGEITKTEYQRMKASFTAQEDALQQAIHAIREEMRMTERHTAADNPFYAHFQRHRNITELNRGVVVELIDTIYVTANKEVIVEFNFADEYRRILESVEHKTKDQPPIENQTV